MYLCANIATSVQSDAADSACLCLFLSRFTTTGASDAPNRRLWSRFAPSFGI